MAEETTAIGPTPGPWQVQRLASASSEPVWGVNGYRYRSLRHQPGVTWGECGGQRLYQGDSEADARLIAAAPDLLIAVRLYSGRVDSWDLTEDEKRAVQRAIRYMDESSENGSPSEPSR